MKPVDDLHAERTRRHFAQLIEPLREVARTYGYALAVHGSLRRDIDLIAVPWIADAAEPSVLAEAIRAKAEEIAGFAYHKDKEGSTFPEYFDGGCPGLKPHGRLTWAFWLQGGSYIDLSVMPLLQTSLQAIRKEYGADSCQLKLLWGDRQVIIRDPEIRDDG